MPNFLRIPKITSRTRQLKPSKDIPFLGAYNIEYLRAYNWLLDRHKCLINQILLNTGDKLAFPIETDVIQRYLTGFQINYIPFDNSAPNAPNVEGWWEWDNKTWGVANIYYNTNCNLERQRFTKVHESLHVCQSLDMEMLSYLDSLITSSTLPEELVSKLLERTTNKATAMYLMPNKYFTAKYTEAKNFPELASYFQVSAEALYYRLKELGLKTDI